MKIKLDKNFLTSDLCHYIFKRKVEKMMSDLVLKFDLLIKKRWIPIKNKNVFYDYNLIALFPNFDEYNAIHINHSKNIEDDRKKLEHFKENNGYDWDFVTYEEMNESIVYENFPFRDDSNGYMKIKFKDGSFKYLTCIRNGVLFGNECYKKFLKEGNTENSCLVAIHRLSTPELKFTMSPKVLILFFIEKDLIPQELTIEEEQMFFKLKDMIGKYSMKFKNGELEEYNKEQVEEDIVNAEIEVPVDLFVEELLTVDQKRFNYQKYDEKLLTDPNRGHWDLWDDGEAGYKAKTDKVIFPRNPKDDVMEDGAVGIDFGTKSTIVVYQKDTEHKLPMRIGTGDLSKKIDISQYENPTVIEFCNLEKFMKEYTEKMGRPNTHWDDVHVSHTAYENLTKGKSEEYSSFLENLKQWCITKDKMVLMDKTGTTKLLDAYMELKDGDFDPIEIYAYYIGNFINNMNNGIYLDYYLSFPVTYEQAVRTKILKSFERGLKQSLPQSILKDEEVMEHFNVSHGANEPAAYAICAMQEFGFKPKQDETIYYGVFDFGGGTTDFDFGVWKTSEKKRYSHTIEHFGSGGDKYLGGENLLKVLAFEIFKENQEKLREANISFTLPLGCKEFLGSDFLVKKSQEAHRNMKELTEQIRPFWERREGYVEKFKTGTLNVNLFDNKGRAKNNFELQINVSQMEYIIKDRIENGVENFFELLKVAFEKQEIVPNEVNILLAGNSSKSPIVKEVFEKHISLLVSGTTEFKVYPPLGSTEAYALQREHGKEVDETDFSKPTGKTGVAFGLLNSKKGGRIEVINKSEASNESHEINFKFYIGYNDNGILNVVLGPNNEYGKWIEFYEYEPGDKKFELHYTTMPEALSNNLNIEDNVNVKRPVLKKVDKEAKIYIRSIGASKIEYVIATSAGIDKNNYLCDVQEIIL